MYLQILFLVSSVLLTILLIRLWYISGKCQRRTEGFENKQPVLATAKNQLLELMTQVKRMSANLSNPAVWSERIEMASLSPMDLARRYIKQTQK